MSQATLPAGVPGASIPEGRAPRRRPRGDGPPPPKPGPWPWLDRGGRFSWFKTAALALLCAPALWLALRWAGDGLGPEPLTVATHDTGDWCVRFLLLSLAVTPARWVYDSTKVVQLRRMIGLAALAYGVVHLLLYIGNEHWRLWHVLMEIVRRPYLATGFTALLFMAVLGWTSTEGWLRRLGREWKPLHRLAYPIVALGILHFFMQSKINVSEPVLMTGLFLWLMLWRLIPARFRGRAWPLLPLAVLAALGAAGIEYLWYALATNLPAGAILAANLEFDFEIRPSVWVAATGLAVAVLAFGERLLRLARR